MRNPGENGGTWASGSSPEHYWAWNSAGAGEGGGRVLPMQGAHGPIVETAAMVRESGFIRECQFTGV